MHAEHLREYYGKEKLVDPYGRGFAVYYPLRDGMYVEDVWVRPEYRKQNVASGLVDKIAFVALTKGLKKLFVTVKPSYKHSTESMMVCLSYGFRLDSSTIDGIGLVKEI